MQGETAHIGQANEDFNPQQHLIEEPVFVLHCVCRSSMIMSQQSLKGHVI